MKVVFADEGYKGKLVERVQRTYGWWLVIVTKISGVFNQPKRWVVERTFAWINNDRRNSKDYERLTESAEAIIQPSMIKTMLKHTLRSRQSLKTRRTKRLMNRKIIGP